MMFVTVLNEATWPPAATGNKQKTEENELREANRSLHHESPDSNQGLQREGWVWPIQVAKVEYSANPWNETPILGRLVLWQIERGMTFERAEAGVKTQETEEKTVEVRRQEHLPKMSRGGKSRSEVPGRVPHPPARKFFVV
jgi:hypothetical protein